MSNYARIFYPKRKTKIRSQLHRRKFIKQKLMGLLLIALTVLIFWLASTGTYFEERDSSAALMTAPIGIYLLFTKHIVIV